MIRASHDGRRLYVLDGVAGKIAALDAGSGEIVGEVVVPLSGQYDEVPGFALTPDDGMIATVTYLGNFVTIDAATMTIESSQQVGHTLYAIALSPDGSHAFIAESNDGCVIDFDMPDGVTSGTGFRSNACFSVAAARDGHSAYLANYDTETDTYSVVAFDSADHTASAVAGFGYPNFDAQSIGPATTTPVAGVWWNPAESGRSFNIEARHGTLVLTAQVYDEQGAPTWLLASGPYDATTGTFSGTFGSYVGGQCLGCPYRTPQYSPANGANVQLRFSSETNGTLTFDGASIPIEKFDW